MIVHMWSHVVAPPEHLPKQHGTCGAHIGGFTQKPWEVNCADCREILYYRLMNVNAVAVVDRPTDWKAFVVESPELWDSGTSPVHAVMELLKSRPELLEKIRR